MDFNADYWIPIRPPFADDEAAHSLFVNLATEMEALIAEHGYVSLPVIRQCRDAALRDAKQHLGIAYQAVCLASSILCDLVNQGWGVQVIGQDVHVQKPTRGTDRAAEKTRVRRSLLLARDEQLSEPAVRAFVRGMESRQLGPKGWHSIFSLMRDGSELADKLTSARNLPADQRLPQLGQTIQPYLQFVTEDARCHTTGLRLADIWRYFRYTWLTPARSVPGRSMMILVRDAAVEPHPIIGIAALSSSIVQQSTRDHEIGWDKASVLHEIETAPTEALACWLLCSLDEIIDGIYTGDLVTPEELEQALPETVDRLNKMGTEEKQKHQIHVRTSNYKQRQDADDWASLVQSHLYRGKRAATLANLLFIRRTFFSAGLTEGSAEQLRHAAQKADFRDAVARLARLVKASHVGINMMDISVAGAVAPYQAILGGKLVSLLLASPEVRQAYAQRYREAASIIASGMKGEPVTRKPDLVLLCTTGLFAGGSSQYNRVRLPAARAGGTTGEIRYQQLDFETEFATFHISQATMDEMRKYSEQWHDGSRVHGIFGEGVNPKMRKITESLARMGFPPEQVLRAGSPRAVYMIPLAHNYKEVLLGRAEAPRYILPDDDPSAASAQISEFWRERWLLGRIHRDDVLSATRRHKMTYPMLHGAAVVLPDDEDTEQSSFEDLLLEEQDLDSAPDLFDGE